MHKAAQNFAKTPLKKPKLSSAEQLILVATQKLLPTTAATKLTQNLPGILPSHNTSPPRSSKILFSNSFRFSQKSHAFKIQLSQKLDPHPLMKIKPKTYLHHNIHSQTSPHANLLSPRKPPIPQSSTFFFSPNIICTIKRFTKTMRVRLRQIMQNTHYSNPKSCRAGQHLYLPKSCFHTKMQLAKTATANAAHPHSKAPRLTAKATISPKNKY